jgi:hypothetical protein
MQYSYLPVWISGVSRTKMGERKRNSPYYSSYAVGKAVSQ